MFEPASDARRDQRCQLDDREPAYRPLGHLPSRPVGVSKPADEPELRGKAGVVEVGPLLTHGGVHPTHVDASEICMKKSPAVADRRSDGVEATAGSTLYIGHIAFGELHEPSRRPRTPISAALRARSAASFGDESFDRLNECDEGSR